MTNLFLVRHAESQANTQGIYQGQTYDTNLSDLGRHQAAALGQRFLGQTIDLVYSSPLKRTRQTASLFSNSYTLIPDLIETNHGAWEGLSKEEIAHKWPKLYHKWLTRPSQVRFPGGEYFPHTQARVVSWYQTVVNSGKTVVAVTHSNIIQCLLVQILGLHLDQIWAYSMQPTAVTLIQDGRLVFHNDISHLKGLKSDLSNHAL